MNFKTLIVKENQNNSTVGFIHICPMESFVGEFDVKIIDHIGTDGISNHGVLLCKKE